MLKDWILEKKFPIGIGILLWILLNLYLGVICSTNLYGADLIYLNILICFIGLLFSLREFNRWKKIKKSFLGERNLSQSEQMKLLGKSLYEYLENEKEGTEAELHSFLEKINNLSDYITKWSHEAKLPLAALRLMNERNQDSDLKKEMQACIVRLETLIHMVMMGSKLERPENDVRPEKTSLSDVVRESVKNQSWYLIYHHFQMKVNVDDIFVYTDKRWLVYLLDQLIGNAIKYRSEAPVLHLSASKKQNGYIELVVEDNGIGIGEEDLPHIFLRGYVGKNQRKGDYHSTGMGLYFVDKIAKMLQITVEVESNLIKDEENKKVNTGCRFRLRFHDLSDYFVLNER